MSNEKTQHTPEPWAYNEDTHRVWASTHESEAYNHNDAIICEMSYYTVADKEASANAARIVQCVNDCEGIENPKIYMSRLAYERDKAKQERDAAERWTDEFKKYAKQLEAQRDELWDALTSIAEMEPVTQVKTLDCFYMARKTAFDAIAAAKGVQQC